MSVRETNRVSRARGEALADVAKLGIFGALRERFETRK